MAEVKVLPPHFKLMADIMPNFWEFDFSESLDSDHGIDVCPASHKQPLSWLNEHLYRW